MSGFSKLAATLVMGLALGSGACDVAPAAQGEQASVPATAEDLADIDMTSSALTQRNSDNAAVEVFHENFEGYPAGSSVGNYVWWNLGNGSSTISADQASQGKQSLKMSVVKDAAFKHNRAASVVCAPWGTRTQLTTSFRIRFSSFGSWNMIGITDNPRMAAWWWVGPDGGLREGNFTMANPKPAMAFLSTNTWYNVKIDIDLAQDSATINLGGVTKTVSLSATWGTIAVPIECVRFVTGVDVTQNVFIDNMMIKTSK